MTRWKRGALIAAGALVVAAVAIGAHAWLETYPLNLRYRGGSIRYVQRLDATVSVWNTDEPRPHRVLVIVQHGDHPTSSPAWMRSEAERVNEAEAAFLLSCNIDARGSAIREVDGEIVIDGDDHRLVVAKGFAGVRCESS